MNIKQKKIKIEPRIKLNYNIYNEKAKMFYIPVPSTRSATAYFPRHDLNTLFTITKPVEVTQHKTGRMFALTCTPAPPPTPPPKIIAFKSF